MMKRCTNAVLLTLVASAMLADRTAIAGDPSAGTSYTDEATFKAALAALCDTPPTTYEFDAVPGTIIVAPPLGGATAITTQFPGVDFGGTAVVYDAQSFGGGGTFCTPPNVLLNNPPVFGQPITFTFDPPVRGVGLCNSSIEDTEQLTLFGCDGSVLFTGVLPLGPVNYLGFISSSAPIASGEVIAIRPQTFGTFFIDSFSFGCAESCPCVNISNDKVACPEKDSDCYTYTFDITNKSGFDVKYVTLPVHPVGLPGVTLSPNVINLLLQDGSLLEDGETTTISIEICGGKPGDEICFEISLKTPDFVECCFQEICFVLPECDCGQLLDQEFSEVSCDREGLASFTFCFTLENLSPFDAEHVIFIPFNDESAAFVKDFFDLPPLASGDSMPFCVEITGAEPGEEFCFYVVLEHAGDECCCGFEKCITVPECPPVDPTGACCFPTGELCLIITAAECESLGGVWQGPGTSCIKCDPIGLPGACCIPGAPCVITFALDCALLGGTWLGPGSTCAMCPFPDGCEGDLNDDGVVNGIDLALLLADWTGLAHYKPCPPTIPADLDENCHVDGVDLAILLGVWGDCP